VAEALETVRVLDSTQVSSGPFCTLQLADLGAQVIEVQIAAEGDPTRHDQPRTDGGESGIGIDLNRRSERR